MANSAKVSIETLVEDATEVAKMQLLEAKASIDRSFKPGFASENPELVAAFLTTASRNYQANLMAQALNGAAENIANALDAIGRAVNSR